MTALKAGRRSSNRTSMFGIKGLRMHSALAELDADERALNNPDRAAVQAAKGALSDYRSQSSQESNLPYFKNQELRNQAEIGLRVRRGEDPKQVVTEMLAKQKNQAAVSPRVKRVLDALDAVGSRDWNRVNPRSLVKPVSFSPGSSEAVDGNADNRVAIDSPDQMAAAELQQKNPSLASQQTNPATAASPKAVRAYHVEPRPKNRVVFIEYEKGPAEIRWDGSWSWRNNNPGNLEAGGGFRGEERIWAEQEIGIFPGEENGGKAV